MTKSRVQTGVRINEKLVIALKKLAQQDNLPLGQFLESLLRSTLANQPYYTTTALDHRVTAVRAQHQLDPPQASPTASPPRIQLGFTIDPDLLKLLRAVADLLDLPLNQLIEHAALAQLRGQPAFSARTHKKIRLIQRIYNAP